jgi:hypothetical protein
LADITEALGASCSRLGRKKESIRCLDQAVKARRGFVTANPDSPEDEYELGRRLPAAALEREVTPVTARAAAPGGN